MNWLAITFGICTLICIVWFFLEGHFVTWRRIRKEAEEECVNFDLDRMKEALKGPFITLPHDVDEDGFHRWMAEQAKTIRERRP